MKILFYANYLDSCGFFKEADKIDNLVLSQNFNLKKKKPTQVDKIQSGINYLQTQISDLSQSVNDGGDYPTDNIFEVKVDNTPVEINKIKWQQKN